MLGFHTNPIDFEKAPIEGVSCLQTFLGSTKSYFVRKIDEEYTENIKGIMEKRSVKVFVHSPYVLSYTDEAKASKSINYINSVITAMDTLGYEKVVLHADRGKTIDGWLKILDQVTDPSRVLLENTAKGTVISYSDLNTIAEKSGCKLCLDTSHYYASGDDSFSPEHTELVHFNACLRERGDRKDNHSNFSIEEGDVNFLKDLVRDLHNVPWISEVKPWLRENEMQLMLEIRRTL